MRVWMAASGIGVARLNGYPCIFVFPVFVFSLEPLLISVVAGCEWEDARGPVFFLVVGAPNL
jgi:hypothetical protein